jgi:hypothetical protein
MSVVQTEHWLKFAHQWVAKLRCDSRLYGAAAARLLVLGLAHAGLTMAQRAQLDDASNPLHEAYVKSSATLTESPTQTTKTQSNHVFMLICVAFKLECLRMKNKLSSFAMYRKLLINASQAAYAEPQRFQRCGCVRSVIKE